MSRVDREMAADDPPAEGFSLKRWSRRKLEAARAASPPPSPAASTVAAPVPAVPRAAPAAPADAAAGPAPVEAPPLPPVDALSFDSDFTAFLQPKVDEALRRQALRKLFRDPRFNVMDGLDVYIDDYSLPDPISPELVRELAHARYIFDPPRTRVGADGVVEDVPPDAPADALPDTPADAVAVQGGGAAAPAAPDGAAARDLPPDDTSR